MLLVDVSGSIDDGEYILQRDGIAQAFRDPAVARAIRSQSYGAIAVTVIEWSSSETIVVPWTIVRDERDTARLANMVASVKRSSTGATSSATQSCLRFRRLTNVRAVPFGG